MYPAVRWSKALCLSAQVFRTRRHFAFKLKLINATDAASSLPYTNAHMHIVYSIQLTSLSSSSPFGSDRMGSDRAAVWELQMRQLHMYAMAMTMTMVEVLSPVDVLHSKHWKKDTNYIVKIGFLSPEWFFSYPNSSHSPINKLEKTLSTSSEKPLENYKRRTKLGFKLVDILSLSVVFYSGIYTRLVAIYIYKPIY